MQYCRLHIVATTIVVGKARDFGRVLVEGNIESDEVDEKDEVDENCYKVVLNPLRLVGENG